MLRAALTAAMLTTLLGGCSALGALGGAAKPLDAYEISAPAAGPVARGRPQSVDMIVAVPTASGAIDTDRILVRPLPTQVQYLPDARWIENAPLMIQSALVDGLERSGAFRYVGRKPLGAYGDFALVSNLAEFHAEIVPETDSATVRVRLTARLVREEDATVLGTQTFEATAVSSDTSTEGIVDAYDRAASRAIQGILEWVLDTRGVRTG
ncbi:ABC-type transport auxiliary lipoprotein family protein [Ostreiculturibacter nitratireducens]|uniref:ABC-type transport auxiliary lipoprotein family protein n=1 Tax=Ostreiculturibacter nitratireducens TaxID=3075226 RepID=UPI0031B5B2FA